MTLDGQIKKNLAAQIFCEQESILRGLHTLPKLKYESKKKLSGNIHSESSIRSEELYTKNKKNIRSTKS